MIGHIPKSQNWLERHYVVLTLPIYFTKINDSYMKQYLRLLPLIILTGIFAYTSFTILFGSLTVDGRQFDYGFTLQHGLALGAIAACWAFVLFKPPFYMPAISMVLLMGIFSIFNFTPSELYFSGSANIARGLFNFSIEFQPTSFLIAVLHLIVNGKELEKLYQKTSPTRGLTSNEVSKSNTDFFKRRLQMKSPQQLKQMLHEPDKYQADALEAARQLLAEKEGEG